MSTSCTSCQSNNYLPPVQSNALQSAGLSANKTNNKTNNKTSGVDGASAGIQADNGQLSPFAQVLSTLQKLQQSAPATYQQVTQQIATNLQAAAQTAQSNGNPTAATQLNQLANDFSNSSTSGQLPNIQDLAQAGSGGHHHHYHSAPVDSGDKSNAGIPDNNASQAVSQRLAAYQANASQNDSLNPFRIISSTLAQAGITGYNG